MTGDRAYIFVLARDFQAALKVWETAVKTLPWINGAGYARELAIRILGGDLTGAQAEAEKARQLLEERLRERPNEHISMTQLSWVYLALKRNRRSDQTRAASGASLFTARKEMWSLGNLHSGRPGGDGSSHRRRRGRYRHSSPITLRFLLAKAFPSRA